MWSEELKAGSKFITTKTDTFNILKYTFPIFGLKL